MRLEVWQREGGKAYRFSCCNHYPSPIHISQPEFHWAAEAVRLLSDMYFCGGMMPVVQTLRIELRDSFRDYRPTIGLRLHRLPAALQAAHAHPEKRDTQTIVIQGWCR